MIREMVKGEKEKMLERNLYIHNRTSYVLVSIDHHSVGNGYSLPRLDCQFCNVTTIVQTFKVNLAGHTNSFIIHYHDPGPYFPNTPLEMIVFRKAKTLGGLVNLCSTDNTLVKQAIRRYMFFSPPAHFPNKPRSFMNRQTTLGPNAPVLTLD